MISRFITFDLLDFPGENIFCEYLYEDLIIPEIYQNLHHKFCGIDSDHGSLIQL